MARRTSLPGAAELFRTTSPAPEPTAASDAAPPPSLAVAPQPEPTGPAEPVPSSAPAVTSEPGRPARAGSARGVRSTRRVRSAGDRSPSGRERHEEKITVYVSPEELVDLESARLTLRGEHGLAVDRGRIVREALAVILADLEAKGDASILVRRLRES